MSSTGPSANEKTTAKASFSPKEAPSTSAIAIPGTTEVPRSQPIPIVMSFKAVRSETKPMASSAPGRFNWERGDIDILGSSPPDKGRAKKNNW